MANGFNNVSIIKPPPYSPEFNPIEQVWSCGAATLSSEPKFRRL
ncbi:transposase [Vibrio kanaloae]